MAKVFTDVQTLLAGASYNLIPPAGEDWEVTDLASSAIVGVAPAGVPNAVAGIFSPAIGVNSFLRNSSAANPHVRGWVCPGKWYINSANYLRITNPEAGPLNIAMSVRRAKIFPPTDTSNVISGTATLIAGAAQAIRPPVGEDWVITDIGSSRWVGAQPNGLPNVEVRLTDGVAPALIMAGPDARGWFKPLEIYLTRNTWLTLTNPAGAGATVSWSGHKVKKFSPTGFTGVVSQCAVLGAGGVGLIRPPVGYEMKVTEIGCSVWVGAPPASLPSITVSLTDGAIAAVAQDGADNKGWIANMIYYLNRGNYMTLTDAGAGSNIAVSATIWKE